MRGLLRTLPKPKKFFLNQTRGWTCVMLLLAMCLHWKKKQLEVRGSSLLEVRNHVNLILISQSFLHSIDHIGAYNWQEWSTCFRSLNIHSMLILIKQIVDAANSISPSPLPSHKLQIGFPEINQVEGGPEYLVKYDNSKQDSILGIKFRSKVETTRDMLEDFSKCGW